MKRPTQAAGYTRMGPTCKSQLGRARGCSDLLRTTRHTTDRPALIPAFEFPRRSRPPSASRRRRGAAAIEFGIILPLFITIVLGCVDFGRFAHSYIAVSHAARVGAGHGMMKRVTTATMANWQNEIRQAVRDEMAHVMASDTLDDTALQVTATHATDPNGLWRVQVEVVYPFETVVAWPVLPSRVDMRRAVVMRGIR